MAFCASFTSRNFIFRFQARTSRGTMREKRSWFLRVWDEANPAVYGIGECGPLPKLSPENPEILEKVLTQVTETITGLQTFSLSELPSLVRRVVPAGYPSIRFALETAMLDLLHGGQRIIFENNFIKSVPIPINGLVWMGDTDQMLQQVTDKIDEGYRCVKIKVGSLNFEKECDILYYIRRKYFRDDITIRLDANGAFKAEDVLYKLHELSRFKVHSIEQPLPPGAEEITELCKSSPIPIALDEELIGVEDESEMKQLLERIRPQFIILKPTLHGGLTGCTSWIKIAGQLKIGFWITSALEANIGLNAICQFAANYPIDIPQGLGTGQLYENNIESPLVSGKGTIRWQRGKSWEEI